MAAREDIGGNEMQRRTVAVAVGSVITAVVVAAGPAHATHPHHLDTPGACVDRSGAGFGIGQVHGGNTGDPGDTTFHERIHKGTPGTFAFQQENNPVSVAGGLCP